MVKIAKMADNFDDGKENKKDSADFTQIMNIVADIKGYIKGLHPVTFTTLRSTLANVLDSYPEVVEFANIKEIFEQLELALKEEQQRVTVVIAALINDQNKAAEAKRIEEEATEKAREKIKRRTEVAGIYKAFDSFYPEALNTQRKDNENLHKVFEATKLGRSLTEAEKEEFKKKPKQIAKEKAHSQHMELTKKLAKEEKAYHANALKKIEERKKQLAHLSEEHHEMLLIANQKKYHEHHQGCAHEKLKQYDVYHQERKQYAQNISVGTKLAKEQGINEDYFKDQAAEFQEIHGVSHEQIATELTVKEQQQDFITLLSSKDRSALLSNNSPILHTQQELEQKQIVYNLKKALIGKGNVQQIQSKTDSNTKPNQTPNVKKRNLKTVNQHKRW